MLHSKGTRHLLASSIRSGTYLSCAFARAGPRSKDQNIGSMYCSILLQYSSSAGGIASATSGSRVVWIATCSIHIHCAKDPNELTNKMFFSLHTCCGCSVRKTGSGPHLGTKRAGVICASNRTQVAKTAAAQKARGLVSWHVTQRRTIHQFHSDCTRIEPGEATAFRGHCTVLDSTQ